MLSTLSSCNWQQSQYLTVDTLYTTDSFIYRQVAELAKLQLTNLRECEHLQQLLTLENNNYMELVQGGGNGHNLEEFRANMNKIQTELNQKVKDIIIVVKVMYM